MIPFSRRLSLDFRGISCDLEGGVGGSRAGAASGPDRVGAGGSRGDCDANQREGSTAGGGDGRGTGWQGRAAGTVRRAAVPGHGDTLTALEATAAQAGGGPTYT